MTQRHLPLKHRPLAAVAQQLPFKTRCGLHMEGLGTAPADSTLCLTCVKQAGGADGPDTDGFTVEQALQQARMQASSDGILDRDTYQGLRSKLQTKDHYAFSLGLVSRQLHPRTGAVNIVDREEPSVGGLGDAGSMGTTNLYSTVGVPGLAELNNDPGGTLELDYGRPRRSEGSAEAEKAAGPSGFNLSDLTVARLCRATDYDGHTDDSTSIIALLNRGVGLEYSQQLRYQSYAEILMGPYRDSLAGEFLDHAKDEKKHAAWLARRVVALGGQLSFKVQAPESFDPDSPTLVEDILSEIWDREESGLEYYLELRDAAGDTPMRHMVEEILVKELEHHDDLARLGHLLHRTAQSFQSEPARWSQSYSDENQFEGLDKMGLAGACAACGGVQSEQGSCPHCQGTDARVAAPLCQQCLGSGRVATCSACHVVRAGHQPGLQRLAKTAKWIIKADKVKRITQLGELPIHIEWEQGDVRKGKSDSGHEWQRDMKADYGYIPGTTGADDEPLDVYLGKSNSRQVHVVNQMKDGDFDEEKCMIGFASPESAEAMYRSHYPKNGDDHFGGMRSMSMDAFLDEYVHPSRAKAAMAMSILRVADHGPGDADGCGEDTGEMGDPTPPKDTQKLKKAPKNAPGSHGAKPSILGPELGQPDPLPAAPKTAPASPAVSKKDDKLLDKILPKVPASPFTQPAAPKEKAKKEKAPSDKPKGKPVFPTSPKVPSVDTSSAVSPSEQAFRQKSPHLNKMYRQFWDLLGGGGYKPEASLNFNLGDVQAAWSLAAEEYEQPDHGPLGTDGEVTHPVEDRVVTHAALDLRWALQADQEGPECKRCQVHHRKPENCPYAGASPPSSPQAPPAVEQPAASQPEPGLMDKIKGLSSQGAAFLRKAPAIVQKLAQDPAYRKQSLTNAGYAIAHAPDQFLAHAMTAAKAEGATLAMASSGMKAFAGGQPMNDAQKAAVKTVATQMAGAVALAAITASGGGIAAVIGKSMAKRVAAKAVMRLLSGMKIFAMEILAQQTDDMQQLASYVMSAVKDELQQGDVDMGELLNEDSGELDGMTAASVMADGEGLHSEPYKDSYPLHTKDPNAGKSGPAVQSPPVGGASGIGA